MMLQILLKCVPFLMGIFAVLNVSARLLGVGTSVNPALKGFTQDCQARPQPCWYGIVIEETSRRAVVVLARTQGFSALSEINSGSLRVYSNYAPPSPMQGCELGISFDLNGTVVDYSLRNCQGIALGDVLQRYGMDARINFNQDEQNTLEYQFPDTPYKIVFSFSGHMRPRTPVESMEIYPVIVRLGSTFEWHGFAPEVRYCQREPQNAECA